MNKLVLVIAILLGFLSSNAQTKRNLHEITIEKYLQFPLKVAGFAKQEIIKLKDTTSNGFGSKYILYSMEIPYPMPMETDFYRIEIEENPLNKESIESLKSLKTTKNSDCWRSHAYISVPFHLEGNRLAVEMGVNRFFYKDDEPSKFTSSEDAGVQAEFVFDNKTRLFVLDTVYNLDKYVTPGWGLDKTYSQLIEKPYKQDGKTLYELSMANFIAAHKGKNEQDSIFNVYSYNGIVYWSELRVDFYFSKLFSDDIMPQLNIFYLKEDKCRDELKSKLSLDVCQIIIEEDKGDLLYRILYEHHWIKYAGDRKKTELLSEGITRYRFNIEKNKYDQVEFLYKTYK